MAFARLVTAIVAYALFACASHDRAEEKPHHRAELKGTSWQLVEIRTADGQVTLPDDPAKYTLEFGSEGRLSARIDCNRGTGTWKEERAGELTLGALATTRAMCPHESLDDRFVRDLARVRSYVTEEGRLFLNLTADGEVYAFEPLAN
jgi:para-nitrobenzyl esterase